MPLVNGLISSFNITMLLNLSGSKQSIEEESHQKRNVDS